jgi:hypothetical protein
VRVRTGALAGSGGVAVRCSSLPLLMLCPGSGRTDDGVLIDVHNDAADDGTDAHRLQASWPDGDAPRYLTDELSEDARIGYFTASKMWREEISAWMPDSNSEVELGHFELTGHADRISVRRDRRTAAVVDWKFGRKGSNYKHQGFGYAFLVFRDLIDNSCDDIDTVTVHFAWVRAHEIESYTVTRERAEQWNRERLERIERWDGKFCTGEHCAHCPRLSTCPAQRQLVRRDVETLTTVGIPDVTAMEPAQLVDFHRRLAVLEAVLKSAKASTRMEVERRGDVLSGDGHVLHLVEENGPRKVDTLKAWPVLNRELDADELAPCISVSIGDAEEAVANKAGKGNGAKAKRALVAELEAVGSITQGKITKLRLERIK